MNLFGLLTVSGSALSAERIRAEVTAVNMANAETTRTLDGGPYRRQQVVFESLSPNSHSFQNEYQNSSSTPQGVRVAALLSDTSEPSRRYDPQHPDADKLGYVAYPNINPLTEMVDLIGASRAYSLNSSAVQATKGMIIASLDILK